MSEFSPVTEAQLNRLSRTALTNPSALLRKEALLEIRKLNHPRVDAVLQEVIAQEQDAEVRDLAQNLLRKREINDMIASGSFEERADSSFDVDSADGDDSEDARVPTLGELWKSGDKWACRFCGTANTGGDRCENCGAHRAATDMPVETPQTRKQKPDLLTEDNFEDVFLLQPGNQKFLSGQTQRIVSALSGGGGCAVLFMLPFLAVGVFVIWMAIHEWNIYNLLNDTGQVARGEYTRSYYETDDDDGGVTYYADYTYSINGWTYTGNQSIGSDLYNRVERGMGVDILYAPSDPSISRIDGTNDLSEFGFLAFFSLLWNGISWGVILGFIVSHRRDQHLAQVGQLVRGEVLSARGSYHKSSYNVRIEYTFEPPDGGGSLKRTQSAKRNDLKGKSLPGRGAPVAVLYKDRRHFKML